MNALSYGPSQSRECSQRSPEWKDLSVPPVNEILNTESIEFSASIVLEACVTEITIFLRAGTGQI